MPKASYALRLNTKNYINMCHTVQLYREAVSFVIDVCIDCYSELSAIEPSENVSAAKLVQGAVEHLIHKTKNNKPRYAAFDRKFYKFPSYLRRAAITDAWGTVCSFKSLTANWKKSDCRGKHPRLCRHPKTFPCMFRENMYHESPMELKLFVRGDWVWVPVSVSQPDLRWVQQHCSSFSQSAPALVKCGHHFELRFLYTYSSKDIPKFAKDKEVSTVLGVDLGVNTDAVCAVVHRDGTVTGRTFIDHPVEKDRLYTDCRVISKSQKAGNSSNHRLWRFVNNYNYFIAVDTASRVVQFARGNHCQVIVLEYLNFTKKIRGSKAQRITLWRKREIAHRIEALAAKFGIRTTYVCPYGTSMYAFDGSGIVSRDKKNHRLCTFTTGKQYNCDLSASYNIAARYFIRAYKKTISERRWLDALAKVPELSKRTFCTLSTVINLAAVLSAPADNTETTALSVEANSAPSKGAALSGMTA